MKNLPLLFALLLLLFSAACEKGNTGQVIPDGVYEFDLYLTGSRGLMEVYIDYDLDLTEIVTLYDTLESYSLTIEIEGDRATLYQLPRDVARGPQRLRLTDIEAEVSNETISFQYGFGFGNNDASCNLTEGVLIFSNDSLYVDYHSDWTSHYDLGGSGVLPDRATIDGKGPLIQ